MKKGKAKPPAAPSGTMQTIDGKAMIEARPPKKKRCPMPSRSMLADRERLQALVAQPPPPAQPAPSMPDNAKARKKTQILSMLTGGGGGI